ncbi:MAG: fatty acid desaturase [Saprospiraceae bacterium]
MTTSTKDFTYCDSPEPHIERTKRILKKHPEIKNLMGRNPNTIYYIIGIVVLQLSIAYLIRDQAWWVMLITAYCIGAFANHALFVLIHECTHNMVFRNRTANLWAGIICDIPNGFPTSTEFRRYHLKHHAFQGHHDLDADLPSYWEARLIGNSVIGKALWLLFFPIFQILRKFRLKEIKFTDKWTFVNLITILACDILVFTFMGSNAFFYLVASLFFSVGLHPLGARWIQEHYLVAPPQETYSYYGPLNKLAFNVGYHNEHHDFAFVPWNNLPKVRAIAPEFYNNLVYHKSWTKLFLKWLKEGDLSLFSRMLREDRGEVNLTRSEKDFHQAREIKETLVNS